MSNISYDEYFKHLNQEGLYKMLSNMTEVPSMEAAKQASRGLLDNIVETCGLPKAKICKASHSLAQVKFQNFNYLAFLYNLNGAQVMLRATDLDTKKFYIPNDVWIAMTNRETEETELLLVLSLSMDKSTSFSN